ncbi:MAG: GNAT family N-acetyltransferase [Candidatus Nanoarchaeia archaeon]
MDFIIRKAEILDIPRITYLNNKERKWVGYKRRDFFKEHISSSCLYVAENIEDKNISGFLLAMEPDSSYDSKNFIWFKERYNDFVYIDRVVISKEARRNGLGSLFYKNLIKDFYPKPLVAEVCVEPMNLESLLFHKKFEFREVGRYSFDKKKNFVMLKRN